MQVDPSSFSAFMELLYDGVVSSVNSADPAIVAALCDHYEVGVPSPPASQDVTCMAMTQRVVGSRTAPVHTSPAKSLSMNGSREHKATSSANTTTNHLAVTGRGTYEEGYMSKVRKEQLTMIPQESFDR